MRLSHKFTSKSSLGDTIVEVIIAIALLGTVMAATYISTTHSLQVGTDAGNRDRAGQYIQQQVEMLKFAEQNEPTVLSAYTSASGPFCIDPSTGGPISLSGSSCKVCVSSAGLLSGFTDNAGKCPTGTTGTDYLITLVYGANNVFTITANWSASNGSGQDQSVVYYKLPS